MFRIAAEDVGYLGTTDFLLMLGSSSLEEVSRAMLVASISHGDLGSAARAVVADVLTCRHPSSLAALFEFMPSEIRDILEDGFPEQIHVITDGCGEFAVIILGVEAFIGPAREIANLFIEPTLKSCRMVAGDASFPFEGRNRAAAVVRSQIRLIG